MPNQRNPKNLISKSQLLFVLACLLIFSVIQYLSQRNNPASPGPLFSPVITSSQQQRFTGTPPEPASLPPTITPAAPDGLHLDSLNNFDYFLLALSWSPDYCATSGNNDPPQCSIGRKLGFVLHGLWPQNNRGYLSNCSTEKLTADVKNRFPGLYPSDSLFDHEWEKHGTCTGLSTAAYLALTRQLKESVAIPGAYRSPQAPFRTTVKQLKQELTSANPGYTTDSLAVNCSSNGRYLKELYVCFSREGASTACSAEVQKDAQKSCQSPDFLVRNIR